MKVLVFGGSSFLGFHLIKKLREKNYEICLYLRENSNLENIKELINDDIISENNIIYGNFHSSIRIMRSIGDKEFDVVFNLIGDTSMSPLDTKRQYFVNVEIAKMIAEVALKLKAKLIHTSSISAYGFHDEVIDENAKSTAVKSGVNYLKTKYLAEKILKVMVKRSGLKAVFLNPVAIIGSHDRTSWAQLIKMIQEQKLPGIPLGRGCYTYVGDVAEAHINAIEKGKVGENYLLSGEEKEFSEIVSLICEQLGVENNFKIRPTPLLRTLGVLSDIVTRITKKDLSLSYQKSLIITKRTSAKSEKAIKELEYKNTKNINEMFKESVGWSLEHRNS